MRKCCENRKSTGRVMYREIARRRLAEMTTEDIL
jgi:hypothetical protein